MYAGIDFDIANPGESEVFSYDFVNDLATGDHVNSASVSLSVAFGDDPDPSSHVDGTPGTIGDVVMQRITDLVAGVNYIIQYTAVTSQGNTVKAYTHIPCADPL